MRNCSLANDCNSKTSTVYTGDTPAIAGVQNRAYLQDCIASVGEPLCVWSVAPGVPSPGTPMHIQYQGEPLGVRPYRQGQVGRQLQAISGLDHLTPHVG